MNEAFALIQRQNESENSDDFKNQTIYSAINDLLKINSTPSETFNELLKIIKWINKYGCNEHFSYPDSAFPEGDFNLYREFGDLYGTLCYGPSYKVLQNSFKDKLRSKKIRYVDATFNMTEPSYIFSILTFLTNIDTIKTVMELYSFVEGEPLRVRPFAQNGKPILSSKIIANCERFYPLSNYSSKIRSSFLLEEDYKEQVNSITSENNDFEVFDSSQPFSSFPKLRNYTNEKDSTNRLVNQYTGTPSILDTYPLMKTDFYGNLYYELASEIICAYLSVYSPEEAVIPKYELSSNTGKFKKKFTPSKETVRKEPLSGFNELHKTLAEAILKSRILRCKYCNRLFVAKRVDAKTCGGYCRNHYQKDDGNN